MRAARFVRQYWLEVIALLLAGIVFIVPFAFMVVTAAKDRAEAPISSSRCRPSGTCSRTSGRC